MTPQKAKGLRRVFFAAAALLVFVVGWFLLNRLTSAGRAIRLFETPGGPPPKAATAVLRVAAYNIAHGRGTAESNWDGGNRAAREERLREIGRLLREADVDLAVLNEVDFDSTWSGRVNQAEAIAREAGFPFRVEGRNLDVSIPFFRLRAGNALLSRFPIREARRIDFPAYSAWEAALAGKKRGIACVVELPSGRGVRVLAVHLEHRSEKVRVASARVIEEERRRDADPMIAAGDFNSTRPGFPAYQTDGSGRSAVSVLLEDGAFATLPDQPPGPEGLTFSSTRPRAVIDWILVTKPFGLQGLRILDSTLSDHRPVVAEVRVMSNE